MAAILVRKNVARRSPLGRQVRPKVLPAHPPRPPPTRPNASSGVCGPVDGILGPRTLAALNQFRKKRGLAPSSQVDDAVRRALEAEHDEMRENVPKAQEEPDEDEPDPMAGDFPTQPEPEVARDSDAG